MMTTGIFTSWTLVGKNEHEATITDAACEAAAKDVVITYWHDGFRYRQHGFIGKDDVGGTAILLAYQRCVDVRFIEIFIHCKGEMPWGVEDESNRARCNG